MMSLLKRAAAALAVLALSACTSLIPSPEVVSGQPGKATFSVRSQEATQAYERVLKGFVNTRGEVDFRGLANQTKDLNHYLNFIAAEPLTSFASGSERLAHFINSYNALSMYNVITSGFPQTHAGLAKVKFFALRKMQFAGSWITLYDLENSIIRPLGEPRVHFALNCSAKACPVLPQRAFQGDILEAQLESETRAFFARAINLRIDEKASRVWVSEILKFYFEDFVAPNSANPSYRLIDYLNRYSDTKIPLHFEVSFIPYDWTVAHWNR